MDQVFNSGRIDTFNLSPHMTFAQNITLALCEVLKMDREGTSKRALSLLERFGLLDNKDGHPDRLSAGGQQQRVAIVWTLAMMPSLMLFDEVTSALDPKSPPRAQPGS